MYEFAIIPDVFDPTELYCNEVRAMAVVQILRGLCDNGLIADLHKGKWTNHVDDLLAKIPPNLQVQVGVKDKILACLNLLRDRHRLVRHPRRMAGDPATDADWLDLALQSHRRIAFSAILLTEELWRTTGVRDGGLIDIDKALDSSAWIDRKRSATISRTKAEYERVLTPIVRHAKTLALVDPRLTPLASRYWTTVEICLNLAGQRGFAVLPCRIHIHAGDPEKDTDHPQSPVDRLDAWEAKIRPLLGPHRVTVFLWGRKIGGRRFHDRYVLTDQCAVSVPGGLDVDLGATTDLTDWNLLDEAARSQHLGRFDENASEYALLAKREVR